MNIKPETLKRYLDFLHDIKNEINKSNGLLTSKQIMRISEIYSLPYSVFTRAKELGYFKETVKNNYKVMVVEFEPIHSRKLIIEKRLKHREVCKKHKQKQTKKEKTPIIKKKPVRIQKQKRQISILWGLIKINY